MSLNLKNLGWDNPDITRQPQRVVLPFTDGRVFVVIADSNTPAAFAQNSAYGDGTGNDVIRVIEIAADGVTVNERATINPGHTFYWPLNAIAADLFEDGSIGLAYLRSTGAITYRKVTIGTWAVSTAENVETVSDPANVRALDLSISKGNAVCVTHVLAATSNPKLELRPFIRNTANAWVASTPTTLLGTSDPNIAMTEVSCQFGRGGSGTSRPLLVMAAVSVQGGANNGHRIYSTTVNEGTGVTGGWTFRKAYLVGDMTTGWGGIAHKQYLFAAGDNNDFLAVVMQGGEDMHLMVAGVVWDGTTFTEDLPPQMSKAGLGSIQRLNRFAATYANSVVSFYYIAEFSGYYPTPVNYIARVWRSLGKVIFSGSYRWDNMENVSTEALFPMGGTGKFAYHSGAKHYMAFVRKNANGLYTARGHGVDPALAPTAVTPSAGSVAPSAIPALSLRGRVGKKFPQSKHKAVWQFATDSNFTLNVRTHTQSDTKFTLIENTVATTSFTYFTDTLASNLSLSSGTWYVRGALVDEYGIMSPWSAANAFTVSHPPTASHLVPNSGKTLASGNVQFGWRFNDPYAVDVQTAFQIVVYVDDTDQVIYDSGKISSANKSHTATLSSTYAGVLLRWTVRLWDGDDAVGPYASPQYFAVAAAPTVVINQPTDGGTLASATPAILFTPTVEGGRNIKKYLVVVYDNSGNLVESSNVVEVDVESGTQLQWRTSEMLIDLADYDVHVWVSDELNLQSTTVVHDFTVDYVAAPSPTGMANNISQYNTDGLAYVEVTWNDTRDPDFVEWQVQRRVNERSFGVTVSTGEWETVGTMTSTNAGVASYWDFYAPSGAEVEYRVRQLVDRSGDRAISASEPVTAAYPQSDGYFLITPHDEVTSYKTYRLSNVTEDAYTDEYEESAFVVIGRGRHVDRGDHLGVTGALTCKVRSTPTKSARQKRMEIMQSKDANEMQYIRTPFGDVWPVSVGNIGVGRIAGVGVEEFVDLSIPYVEVYEGE